MGDELEVVEQTDSGGIASQPHRTVEDILASRAVATDRVFKGGILAVLGFGGTLFIDVLNLSPGLPLWIGITAALITFGGGAVWAGSGASHLARHGRKGSSLWLASLAGLGGSVILNVVSGILGAAWGNPVLAVVNYIFMASCGLFTAALIVLGLLTLVRWMLPDRDPVQGSAEPRASDIE